jgi:hypothetical protein
MRTGASLLLALLVSTGCLVSRGQVNVADLRDRVGGVVVDKTTIDEVEDMIGGPPISATPVGGGLIAYSWAFGDTKTMGLTLVIINITKTNSGIDTAVFVADKDRIVRGFFVGENSKDVPWQWWAFGD